MTIVRATCPECGDVELGIDDISVTGTREVPRGFHFTCDCGIRVEGDSDADTMHLLVAAGARVVAPRSHRTYRHMHPSGGGRAFTERDVLALRETLDRTDWYEELLDLL